MCTMCCTHGTHCQNKVMGIIVFATLILEMSLHTTIKYEACC